MDEHNASQAERSAFSGRLVELLRHAGRGHISATVLARAFNAQHQGQAVTTHAVRKWLLGQALPTQDKLRTLARMFSVEPHWLRYGSGRSVGDGQGNWGKADSSAPGIVAGLGPHDADFLRRYLSLESESKRVVCALTLEFVRLTNAAKLGERKTTSPPRRTGKEHSRRPSDGE